MSISGAENPNFRIFLQSDDAPKEFITHLVQSVFKKSNTEAAALARNLEANGSTICGSYPSQTAIEMLVTAQESIRTSGRSVEVLMDVDDVEAVIEDPDKCALCSKPHTRNRFSLKDERVLICDDCIAGIVRGMPAVVERTRFRTAFDALSTHFVGLPRDGMIATARQFPWHMRADIQIALNRLFSESAERFFGINEDTCFGTLTFAALNTDGNYAVPIAPAQYEELDIGEGAPVKCLYNGLWLSRKDELRYAVVLSKHRHSSEENGIRIEIVTPPGEAGIELAQACFAELEKAVSAARSYRGKTLSFDADEDYRGRSKGVLVHRLPNVRREDVILPDATLKLLDRNVVDFVGKRTLLRQLGQSTRKGILLYGPPGTGKTHTIRYLASNLSGYTTLIITGGQIGLLTRYMNLARLMQPALVVIEDVDLIARKRENMGPCEESMLNQLLNQMDGLKEDADIMFILTTNRPEQLEEALASRPGRIDQAIEVPLPDEIGRAKLVRLYGKGLPLADSIVEDTARRTNGVSAAFIKELMRRVAQESISRDGGASVVLDDVSLALQDMLFSGGQLNVKLLGGVEA